MLSLSYDKHCARNCRVGLAAMLTSCMLLAATGSPAVQAKPPSKVVGTVVYLPVIHHGMPLCNDVEDNDVPDQAQPLIPLSQVCRGSFDDDPVGEDDYYSTTLADGQIISVELTAISADADYDLILYRSGSSESVAASNELGNVDERIAYTVPSGGAGTYFVRLNIYAKSTTAANSYVLRADIQ